MKLQTDEKSRVLSVLCTTTYNIYIINDNDNVLRNLVRDKYSIFINLKEWSKNFRFFGLLFGNR